MMSSPTATEDFDATVATPMLSVTWSPGTGRGGELPANYFDGVRVALDTDSAVRGLISGVAHTAEREIVVSFNDLSTFLMTSTELAFTLEFPDRRGFIDCEHPGMKDRYLLDVSLSIDAAGALVDQELSQRVVLGAI